MKLTTEKKPWYFAWVVISGVATKFLDMLVEAWLGSETFERILGHSFTIRQMLPWVVAIVTLFVCLIIYAYQRIKSSFRLVLSENNDKVTKYINRLMEDEYVESAQAYKYTISNDNVFKYIKCGFFYGKVRERIEINSILQTYFYIPHPVYKKMVQTKKCYMQYINASDPNIRANGKYAFKEKGAELCRNLLQILNGIERKEDIKEEHLSMYRILAVVLPAITDETPYETFLENKEIEKALISKKKTGLLGGIILDHCYVFRNECSLAKKNRIYVTFHFEQEQNVLILISINAECFQDPHLSDIEEYCIKLFERAYDMNKSGGNRNA